MFLGYTGEDIYRSVSLLRWAWHIRHRITGKKNEQIAYNQARDILATPSQFVSREDRGLEPTNLTPNVETYSKFTQPGRFQEAMKLLGEESSDDTASPDDPEIDEEESYRRLEQDWKSAPNPSN